MTARPPQDGRPQQALQSHYESLPKAELHAQGRAFLASNVRLKTRRTLRLGWLAAWTLIIAGVVLIGTVSIWLLFKAKDSGSHFGEQRRQAEKVLAEDPP